MISDLNSDPSTVWWPPKRGEAQRQTKQLALWCQMSPFLVMCVTRSFWSEVLPSEVEIRWNGDCKEHDGWCCLWQSLWGGGDGLWIAACLLLVNCKWAEAVKHGVCLPQIKARLSREAKVHAPITGHRAIHQTPIRSIDGSGVWAWMRWEWHSTYSNPNGINVSVNLCQSY